MPDLNAPQSPPDDDPRPGPDSPGTGEQLRATLQPLADAIAAASASLRRALEAGQTQFALAPPPADEQPAEPVHVELHVDGEALTRVVRGAVREGTPGPGGHAVTAWQKAYQRAEEAEQRATEAEHRAEIADDVTARTKELLARRTTTLRKRAEQAEAERDQLRDTITRVRKRLTALKLQGATGMAYYAALNDDLDGIGAPPICPCTNGEHYANCSAIADETPEG